MAGYASGFNTFVPSFEASGHLVVSFSRNPKSFALNRYVQIVPVTKSVGYFLNLTAAEAARVINTNLSDFIWPDGNAAPDGNWGLESFTFVKYSTSRYAYPFAMGRKAEEQADWNILAHHAAIKAQQAMTARTLQILTLATTTGNWGSHTDTATNLSGGKWDAGTPTAPYIKKSLNAAAHVIMKDTLGVVQPKDMVLVIAPNLATKMSESQEVHTYLKENPIALDVLKGNENVNAVWGLPPSIYGYPIVVEDTVRVSTHKDTRTADYALSGDVALLVSRPGGLVGVEGTPSFSTLTVFAYEEMSVEQRDDPDNRRVMGRVVDDFASALTASAAGYLIQDTLT